MPETISIVLPVKNAESTLERAVKSVLNQTYTDFKLLIVLNGCDKPKSFYDSLLSKFNDDRIIILESKPGLVNALNRGIWFADRIDGKYIARQDADDLWYPDKLQHQIDFLKNNTHVSILGTQMQLVDKHFNSLNQQTSYPLEMFDIVQEFAKGHNALGHSSVIFTKDVIQRTGGYDDTFFMCEDYHLWMRAIKWFVLANLPDVLVDYTFVQNQNYDARVPMILSKAMVLIHNNLYNIGK
ncbi:glycosyltransferase [bacterium]|nr:glycosyltransferase [bacterium]